MTPTRKRRLIAAVLILAGVGVASTIAFYSLQQNLLYFQSPSEVEAQAMPAGRQFRLGPIQAQVIRALHEAACAGEPWQSGKAILSAAGSKSLKMSDVFKSQKQWRSLIESNGRGNYRLNCG